MAVVFTARHAAADELAVILEVNGKELLAALQPTDLPDPILHIQPLLRRQKQLCGGIHPYRHIVEIPCEITAFFNEHIQELVAGYIFVVPAGIADRYAEGNVVGMHQLHGADRAGKVAVPAPGIVRLREALQTDGNKEVSDPEHLLAEVIVDERPIRKGVERHVAMLVTELEDVVLANQRFAAGKQAGMQTQRLSLRQQTNDK